MAIHSTGLSRIKTLPSKPNGEQQAPTHRALERSTKDIYLSECIQSLETTPQHPIKQPSPLVITNFPRYPPVEPRRTSFESVREGDSIQSFVSWSRHQSGNIPQIDGTVDNKGTIPRVMMTSALLPSSALKEWRPDLRHLVSLPKNGDNVIVNELDEFGNPVTLSNTKRGQTQANHILERLPYEVLDQILGYLLLDAPPRSHFTPRNADLMSCLLTCRALQNVTLNVLYKHATIPHSRIFAKMFNVISKHPSLGALVRRLDFSHYTVIGLGRTKRANKEAQYLTSQNLAQCLRLMPKLREFLVHEHIDDVLDQEVLKTLFSMPSIQAIDLCACSSTSFVQSFDAAVTNNQHLPAILPNLHRISLHECSTLQAPAFELLLPRLPNLTHLEVAHTLITDKALLSIPPTAHLTHLNLSKCTKLTGANVVDFLLYHPSAKSLQYLSLMSDAARHQLLNTFDLTHLLPALPPSLRSLNLNGSDLRSIHLPFLLPLRSQLDELAVAHTKLTLSDINHLFLPVSPLHPFPLPPPSLSYIDLTALPPLNDNSRAALFSPLYNPIFHSSPSSLITIEISSDPLVSSLRSRYSIPGNGLGWILQESGRRAWLVRDDDWDGLESGDDGVIPSSINRGNANDDEEAEEGKCTKKGEREWKWGAKGWGMRKVAVARMGVGGMFGYWGFKA